jgi:hypothetical protein
LRDCVLLFFFFYMYKKSHLIHVALYHYKSPPSPSTPSERPASIPITRLHSLLEFYDAVLDPTRHNAPPSSPKPRLNIRPTNSILIERVLPTLHLGDTQCPALVNRSKSPFLMVAQILPIRAGRHHLGHNQVGENVAVAERGGGNLCHVLSEFL